MADAFMVDGIRTPIGSLGGSLSTVRADDLAAHVIAKLIERNPNVPTDAVTDVILGCANQAGEDNRNVARMALLLAGLPVSVAGETVNRLCASGMSAVVNAARGVRLGDGDVYIAGGVEHMTSAPFVQAKASQAFSRSAEMFDTSIGWRLINSKMREKYGVESMGQTAENVAEQFGITREDQDLFACRSQEKAAAARTNGRFDREVTPITIPSSGKGREATEFGYDEFLRPDTTIEKLARLKPAFRTDGKGSGTAGNSSGINDGACAIFVVSESALKV